MDQILLFIYSFNEYRCRQGTKFVPTDAVFNNFRLITDTELRKLLTICNLKSCEFDPLPHLLW